MGCLFYKFVNKLKLRSAFSDGKFFYIAQESFFVKFGNFDFTLKKRM